MIIIPLQKLIIMKISFFSLLLLLPPVYGFSQDLSYDIYSANTNSITKVKLIGAMTFADICSGYPVNWIKEYISAEISTSSDSEIIKAESKNDVLSTDQMSILDNARIGTIITIDVKYKSRNSVTNIVETHNLNFTTTVVPEKEAEYSEGYEQLLKFIKENAINKISESDSKQMQQGKLKFIVDADGVIRDATLLISSSNPEIDKLLLDTIMNMPKWKPAETENGTKVKQVFEFKIGNMGC